VGLVPLWIATSFGVGAGMIGLLGFGAVAGSLGLAESFTVPVLGRGLLLLLLARGARRASVTVRAALLAGAAYGAFLCSVAWSESRLHHLAPTQALTLLGETLGLGLAVGFSEFVTFWLTRGAADRVIGHVSRDRLVALLDLSHPLLKRMMERAPGSFEHSRAMANLAEQAASSIGADALLTRVGAYYHDLGKSVEPKFFIENLLQGETSAHQGLTPLESAEHILRHVTEGVRILREAGIPEPIVEFSYTHHGSQYVEYFLNQQQKLRPGCVIDRLPFAYPGMRPSTKETAILMLVDSIEAASRTIDSRDPSQIRQLVSQIVFSKLSGGQLDDSGLAAAELKVLTERVVDTLVYANHHRVKYPWQEESTRRNSAVPVTVGGPHKEKQPVTFPRSMGVA
jgi:putative nucleotidyltransferase with HDIG domain